MQDPAPPPDPLGRRVVSATRWSLLNTVVIRIGTFGSSVILARYLLSPSDWGLYAVGLVALTILLSANEMGVSLAMVRWDGDVRRYAPTVLTLSTISSVGLYGLFFLAAPTIARLLGSAQATNVLRVLCFSVVIDGLACVPNGYITREFRQVTRMMLDLGSFVVSTGLTVALAVAHFGAMSFAWGAIAGNVVALTGAVIAAPGLLRFGWDRDQARALLRFGLPLAGASLLVLAMLSVDSAVVGAVLGPAALGLYQVAFNVSSWPVRIVSDAARRVSFAGFSRIAHSRDALSDGFCMALTFLLAAATPAAVVLGVLAVPVIHLIYGSAWTQAARALQFLAFLGLLRVAFEAMYDCLVAAHRRRDLLVVQGLWFVALIPVLLILARRGGIEGVGLGHVLVAALLIAPAFIIALARAGIRPGAVARAAVAPLLWGGLAAATAALIRHWLGDGVVGLAAAGAGAMLAYAPMVLRLRRLVRKPVAPPSRTSTVDSPGLRVSVEVSSGG
jgi:PST family polysaccharide transporter